MSIYLQKIQNEDVYGFMGKFKSVLIIVCIIGLLIPSMALSETNNASTDYVVNKELVKYPIYKTSDLESFERSSQENNNYVQSLEPSGFLTISCQGYQSSMECAWNVVLFQDVINYVNLTLEFEYYHGLFWGWLSTGEERLFSYPVNPAKSSAWDTGAAFFFDADQYRGKIHGSVTGRNSVSYTLGSAVSDPVELEGHVD